MNRFGSDSARVTLSEGATRTCVGGLQSMLLSGRLDFRLAWRCVVTTLWCCALVGRASGWEAPAGADSRALVHRAFQSYGSSMIAPLGASLAIRNHGQRSSFRSS